MKIGTQVKHRRKRIRGKVVAIDRARDYATIELRSGHRRTVPMLALTTYRGWAPWNGHAQVARERTTEEVKRFRERMAASVGGTVMPGPSVHEMSAVPGRKGAVGGKREAKRRRDRFRRKRR